MRNFFKAGLMALALVAVLSSCSSQEEDIFTPNENLIGADKETNNPCCWGSSWDCTDLDAGAGVRATGMQMPYYANQVGWTRYVYPFRTQRWGASCFGDKDHRIYFTSSYFANPANHGNIRVRVVDGSPNCSGTPVADYLTAAPGNALGLAAGTHYVRVTLGQYCDSNVLLVAP